MRFVGASPASKFASAAGRRCNFLFRRGFVCWRVAPGLPVPLFDVLELTLVKHNFPEIGFRAAFPFFFGADEFRAGCVFPRPPVAHHPLTTNTVTLLVLLDGGRLQIFAGFFLAGIVYDGFFCVV